jgi:hypothetical protein
VGKRPGGDRKQTKNKNILAKAVKTIFMLLEIKIYMLPQEIKKS